MIAEAGSLDEGDLLIEAERLARDRQDIAEELHASFEHVMVDELEEAAPAHMRFIAGLVSRGAREHRRDARRGGGDPPLPGRERGLARVVSRDLSRRGGGGARGQAPVRAGGRRRRRGTHSARSSARRSARGGAVRFWRCEGERAQAQAAAREIESRLSAGETLPERICVVVGGGWRQGRLVAAALEERSVPFRVAGDASFFARPEVRDALAWLRMLADPFDAAAVVRALTRPPVDLRSADLARVTTIARRRKLDMVTALDAALESPQLRPRRATASRRS